MPEPEHSLESILLEFSHEKGHERLGDNNMVTDGPLHRAIDPVSYNTKYSLGKMGYAIAQAALQRGARVTGQRKNGSDAASLYMDVVNASVRAGHV